MRTKLLYRLFPYLKRRAVIRQLEQYRAYDMKIDPNVKAALRARLLREMNK